MSFLTPTNCLVKEKGILDLALLCKVQIVILRTLLYSVFLPVQMFILKHFFRAFDNKMFNMQG